MGAAQGLLLETIAVGEEIGADLAAGAGEMVEGVEIDVTCQDGNDTVCGSVSRTSNPWSIVRLEVKYGRVTS